MNPKSLKNLRPGANKKNAVRVTLTLKPKTVALLSAQGNMSQAVDKLIELCCLGLVQHDGCLNPIPLLPVPTDVKLESQDAHSVIETIAPCNQVAKPDFWIRRLTQKEMITCGYATVHKLKSVPFGASFIDARGTTWWKEPIEGTNENLRPLGSRAKVLYCR
ncbi:hypothetical protein [Microcoleus sp. herbarium14]|uniref:hypothetical protein n=1 Tax=Microcoleus sp. herbarium14 TaxID=3055439 RepID=UPI002FCFC446